MAFAKTEHGCEDFPRNVLSVAVGKYECANNIGTRLYHLGRDLDSSAVIYFDEHRRAIHDQNSDNHRCRRSAHREDSERQRPDFRNRECERTTGLSRGTCIPRCACSLKYTMPL